MYTFTIETMSQIITLLKEELKPLKPRESINFEVLNPDLFSSYNGHIYTINETKYIYRGYKSWIDLAQLLQCRMLTPKIHTEHTVLLKFQKLNTDSSFHTSITDKEEKYGKESIFSQIYKNEETAFIYYYLQALQNVKIDTRVRILNLGINSGDEFEAILSLTHKSTNLELVGIDY